VQQQKRCSNRRGAATEEVQQKKRCSKRRGAAKEESGPQE